jgi:putative ATP-dependent endonuclease of OLD family
LLSDLGIPYATLLDLDLGREGGGFGRVKTAIKRLLEIGIPKIKLLQLGDGTLLSDDELEDMHNWQDADQIPNLQAWIGSLQPHGVFFSAPLDLDLALLAAFPNAYKAIVPKGGGPRMTVQKATEAVFGSAGPGITLYTEAFKAYPEVLPAYRYHFLTNSKPATHLAALTHLNRKELRKGMPDVLADVLNHVEANIRRD